MIPNTYATYIIFVLALSNQKNWFMVYSSFYSITELRRAFFGSKSSFDIVDKMTWIINNRTAAAFKLTPPL